MDVSLTTLFVLSVLNLPHSQIAIPAGHEFIISTDPKYSEVCDEKVVWVDYVRNTPHFVSGYN